MELRDLRFFSMAAQMQHISKAAERLGVSQPFLTKVIKQLEAELGVPLIESSGRGIALTTYGELLYTRANEILKSVDSIYDDISDIVDVEQKTLKLMTDAGGYMPQLVLACNRNFPDSKLIISYGFRDEIISAVENNSVDFALCTPSLTGTELKHISTETVYTEHGCVLLPPESPLLLKEKVSINDLRTIPLITSPIGAGVRNNVELFFTKYGFSSKIVCESHDMNLIVNSVMSGIGYAYMPTLIAKDQNLGKYSRAMDWDFSTGIDLCWNKNNSDRQSTKEFVEFIKAFFAKIDAEDCLTI